MRGFANVRVWIGVAAVVAGSALPACGSANRADESAAPSGWPRLRVDRVSVSHPPDWAKADQGDFAGRTTGTVVLTRDGARVAQLVVKLRFMVGGDVGVAAAGAMASLQPGARIIRNSRLEVDGKDAEKIEYSYRAAGSGGGDGVAAGTRMRGVDVVTMDADEQPLLVRITAAEGTVNPDVLTAIVRSISLGAGG
jgi:hypothetical protein